MLEMDCFYYYYYYFEMVIGVVSFVTCAYKKYTALIILICLALVGLVLLLMNTEWVGILDGENIKIVSILCFWHF